MSAPAAVKLTGFHAARGSAVRHKTLKYPTVRAFLPFWGLTKGRWPVILAPHDLQALEKFAR
jgi:hypothetical protein